MLSIIFVSSVFYSNFVVRPNVRCVMLSTNRLIWSLKEDWPVGIAFVCIRADKATGPD